MVDDTTALLAGPPRIPVDVARFSSNTLFGQPGIYPDGPPMVPATGHRHSDASIELAIPELAGTVAEPVLDAWNAGRLAVARLTYGAPESPGRIVGPAAGGGAPVVNDRYACEDARLLLPSIVHALCWSGPGAGHAEETLLHTLGAYVHAQLLAREPALAATTELARRQSSITITLLNSRRPGTAPITLVAPDGPGTIPGGAPAMQTPDFWSVPFGPRASDGGVVPGVVRAVLRGVAGDGAGEPDRYDDTLGVWCSEHLGGVLRPEEQLAANRALGLLP